MGRIRWIDGSIVQSGLFNAKVDTINCNCKFFPGPCSMMSIAPFYLRVYWLVLIQNLIKGKVDVSLTILGIIEDKIGNILFLYFIKVFLEIFNILDILSSLSYVLNQYRSQKRCISEHPSLWLFSLIITHAWKATVG